MLDSALLEPLRMFYRYLKVKRGLVELVIPKSAVRINCIKVGKHLSFVISRTNPVSGWTEDRDCRWSHWGSWLWPWTSILSSSWDCREGTDHHQNSSKSALCRPAGGSWILQKFGPIGHWRGDPCTTNCIAVFIVLWLFVYLDTSRNDNGRIDVQVVVTTAFTIASYLLTAGKYYRYVGHSWRRWLVLIRCLDHRIGGLLG